MKEKRGQKNRKFRSYPVKCLLKSLITDLILLVVMGDVAPGITVRKHKNTQFLLLQIGTYYMLLWSLYVNVCLSHRGDTRAFIVLQLAACHRVIKAE